MELKAATLDMLEGFLGTIPSEHARKNYVNGVNFEE